MIKTDCAYFKLDRPCDLHKEKGVKCGSCKKYSPLKASASKHARILIIKLDAMGDVLRTTFLLPGLKEKYRNCRITWVVAPESAQILENIPLVDRVWISDREIYKKIVSEKFDIVINLDLSAESLGLATLAVSPKKIGYYLDKNRGVQCSNTYAKKWLAMSAFDDLKKANTRTFQYYMSKIAGLKRDNYEICVPLREDSVAKAAEFARKNSLEGNVIVGLNPGAGKRWKMKKWTTAGYLKLIEKITKSGSKVILLGGKGEEDIINELTLQAQGKVINTGTDNSICDFFALINLCDTVITGDTMALHAALGLKKSVVALFGPTSAPEIETYGRGIKVVGPVDCVCCYRMTCDKQPNCMELITPDKVWNAFLQSFGQGIIVI